MVNTVDSYRFISGITRRMIKSWNELEKPRPIVHTASEGSLQETKTLLVSMLKTADEFNYDMFYTRTLGSCLENF
jgi:hypothetical protein